jgi:hypothetical protein
MFEFLSLSSIGGTLSLFMMMVLMIGAIAVVFTWNKYRETQNKKGTDAQYAAIIGLQSGLDACAKNMQILGTRIVQIENYLKEEDGNSMHDARMSVSDGGYDEDGFTDDVGDISVGELGDVEDSGGDDNGDDVLDEPVVEELEDANIEKIDVEEFDVEELDETGDNDVDIDINEDDVVDLKFSTVNTDKPKLSVPGMRALAIEQGHPAATVKKMKRTELLELIKK